MYHQNNFEHNTKGVSKAILHAHRLLAITGAGISAPSGLPTIEATWHGRTLTELFQLQQAHHHIQEYQNAYRDLIATWLRAQPNAAHYLLAEHGVRIITQNVDGLHQRAGSSEVIELHGSLTRLRCHGCRSLLSVDTHTLSHTECPACGELLWPDIVFEGEYVKQLAKAIQWVSTCDALLIIGTSLHMHPVSQLPRIAIQNGVPLVRIRHNADQVLAQYFTAHGS
ncbi:SIR2 family NAD-dependent protein deacylase [Sulfoacidibacillus thermotolerans]|uniref:protein acetyllysine N-acetyltransferase n=1 Tax=Sulfoacidibacillus thermotolerans TaxID=1765684 RepID=A0A2U3DCN8_SULT2|nr:Sir2 family NAD-dependent protein deacetylase [Sulfoacidibacillus thermotolerans]PWI59038.1 hypothetical protein BM613_00020 [Sulfoacidibacillus thermotolerans]